jgi:hypothetical protein
VRCCRLIDQEKAHHGVSRLARVLGVAHAGYYALDDPAPGHPFLFLGDERPDLPEELVQYDAAALRANPLGSAGRNTDST